MLKSWFKSYLLVMLVCFFALPGLGENMAELNKVSVSELLKRAEAGDVDAQYNAGLRYYWGNRGVEEDKDQAAKWFQKASDQGYVRAQTMVGRMTVLGWGFPRDVERGLQLMQGSAENGDGGACWILGTYYEQGKRGVEMNLEKAEFWYQKGADLGHAKSKKELGEFRERQGVVGSGKKVSVSRSKPAKRDSVKESLLPEGSDLKVKIKRERLSKKECKQLGFEEHEEGKTDVEYDGYRYALDLRNTSVSELKDLSVSCRCYYEEEKHWDGGGFVGSQNVKRAEKILHTSDKLTIDSISPKGRAKEEAGPFVLTSTSLRGGYYYSSGEPDNVTSDLKGLWVRVSYTTPDGQRRSQDFCDPPSLSSDVTWR